MPTPDCLSYAWFNHSNIPCNIRLILKLNRHLAGQGTIVWFRNAAAGSTRESSPVRTLWKLAGVTLICHKVRQLWQARRIAFDGRPWEHRPVAVSHWWASVGLVTGSARSPKVTEARATHSQSQAFLPVDIHTEAREAESLGMAV